MPMLPSAFTMSSSALCKHAGLYFTNAT
jgi:hypothetical protein